MWYKPNMALTREQWMKNSQLRVWHAISCTTEKRCECEEPATVELWEQDFCSRGRIDTKICVKCNNVESFSIVR